MSIIMLRTPSVASNNFITIAINTISIAEYMQDYEWDYKCDYKLDSHFRNRQKIPSWIRAMKSKKTIALIDTRSNGWTVTRLYGDMEQVALVLSIALTMNEEIICFTYYRTRSRIAIFLGGRIKREAHVGIILLPLEKYDSLILESVSWQGSRLRGILLKVHTRDSKRIDSL